ncbi:YkoP family protein [Bacillus massilinigeriensis]|uniref:YkoP family protein n=1 Tax=Bacillus massilionigeriensis TaxID=1805475 RepID=UPI0009FC33C3|nr:hypothetical protein [Bacillus massilionigeriensis]
MSIRPFIISLWNLFDPIYFIFTRLHYIPSNSDIPCIFRVRTTRYRGADIILSDGTSIKKNDLLLKIHLHNSRILKESLIIRHSLKKGRVVYKMVLHSMPILAEYIEKHPKRQLIKGIIGVTTINKGVKSLGFDLVFPKSKLYQLLKRIMQFPIYALSATTFSLEQIKKNKPVYLLMSVDKLCQKYLKV